MTLRGTFIINGAERVVVNQIHRSPGVFFGYDKLHAVYSTKIIPDKGAWLEMEIDNKGFIIVRIDRKRKIVLGTFLKAIGLGTLGIYKIDGRSNNSVTISISKQEALKIPISGKVVFIKNESDLEGKGVSLYIVNKKILDDKDDKDDKKIKVKLEFGELPYEKLNTKEDIVE